MKIEQLRNALLYCTAINFGLLAVWALLFVSSHAWLHRLVSRWFRLSVEQFAALNYAGIVLYKISIYLLNLVPYLVLCFLV